MSGQVFLLMLDTAVLDIAVMYLTELYRAGHLLGGFVCHLCSVCGTVQE